MGLKIGRRSVDLTLIDFLGRVRAVRRRDLPLSDPRHGGGLRGRIACHVAYLPIAATARPDRRNGHGDAVPAVELGAVHRRTAGRDGRVARRAIFRPKSPRSPGCRSIIQNDATAACGAELVFGTGERPQVISCISISAYFIGGGLVLNGQLFTGRTRQCRWRRADAGSGARWTNATAVDVASMSIAGRGDGCGRRTVGSSVGNAGTLAGQRRHS